MNNDLDNYRKQIDSIDNKIKELFEKRMNIAFNIAKYKKENNLPILNTSRERDIICRITENQSDEMAIYSKILYSTLFDLSKSYQNTHLYKKSNITIKIKNALLKEQDNFPKSAIVACQGIEGANSQYACEHLFKIPKIIYFNTFDSVFSAVEKGVCNYGILPLENNIHGSVTSIYDLMKKYKFHIIRSTKLKINHTLLCKKGSDFTKIKEIYSHKQALGQCSQFLEKHPNIKIIQCENTAIAAKIVSETSRDDIAAISTKACAKLYNLNILSENIQNSDNNYTRFICISRDLEIYKGANKISLMFTISHKSGSLYNIISKFSALGINLTKIESRPIPNKDFEFMFFVDFDASIYSKETLNLINQLENSCEYLVFLGSYTEI